MASQLATILDAIADTLEAATPTTRAGVLYRRWRGAELVETVPLPMRERAFQLRLGASRIPRTMSSVSTIWHRAELLLVIGYSLDEPRQGDSNGLGVHLLPWTDEEDVRRVLAHGSPLSGVSGVLRLLFLGADSPTATSRTYRFDLEWSRSY
jgi:hypothetical protein